MLFIFISVAPQKVLLVFSCPSYFSRELGGSIESELGCETGSISRGRSFGPCLCRFMCFQLSMCGSFVKKPGLVVPFVLQCLLWFNF